MKTATAQKLVKAPADLCYQAFTNATALREWLCDVATVAPRRSGRIYLWWRGDFYSAGRYLEVDKPNQVKFTWFSNIDPAATEVTVTFTPQGADTLVRMDHSVPEEPAWEGKAEAFRQNWDDSLDNLKSVLETGIDLRIADRPMVGIVPGDFTPEQAAHLGVPVSEGMRLDGTVEGMGAYAAGLRKDDVIVALNGKAIRNDGESLPAALAGKKGGQDVEVTFYRGAEKHTVTMTLTRRPMVDVPFDPAELVARARPVYEAGLQRLEQAFAGASDAQAAARPGPGEWSALDVMAHLILSERFQSLFMEELVGGQERWADDWSGNLTIYTQSVAAAYPTIAESLAELRRAIEVNLATAAALPPELVARRGSFYRLGSGMLQGDFHLNNHIDQIQAALAAAA